MDKKFRRSVYVFKTITPSKKYSSFEFFEFTWDEILLLSFDKNAIFKIEEMYFVFSHELAQDLNQKSNSVIVFKHRNKIIKTIEIN